MADIDYRRGFNAAQDEVLNLLGTIDSSIYDGPEQLRKHIFKEVEKIKART